MIKDPELDDTKINQIEESQLVERLATLSTSNPTREVEEEGYETDSKKKTKAVSSSKTLIKIPSTVLYGLRNSTSIVQEFSKKPGKYLLREQRGTYNSTKSITPVHYYQDQRGKAEQMMNFVLKEHKKD